MYYEEIFVTLNKKRVRYIIAGGIAVVLHGAVRLTADLDIIVDFTPSNILKFSSVMGRLGYKPRVPVKIEDLGNPLIRAEWKKEKNMKVFSLYHPKKGLETIDVFIEEFIPFTELYREKMVVMAKKIKIPIVSITHLIRLKQIAARPQDLADIKSLQELRKIQEG